MTTSEFDRMILSELPKHNAHITSLEREIEAEIEWLAGTDLSIDRLKRLEKDRDDLLSMIERAKRKGEKPMFTITGLSTEREPLIKSKRTLTDAIIAARGTILGRESTASLIEYEGKIIVSYFWDFSCKKLCAANYSPAFAVMIHHPEIYG